tara:strand:+ start:40 stop:687 length:648 start_codon:yes stop_codon:yes gene_type:complete
MKETEKRMLDIQTINIFGDEVFHFKMPNHTNWLEQIKQIIKIEDNPLHNFNTGPDEECHVKAKRTAWDSNLRYPAIGNLTTELIEIILKLINNLNYDAPNIKVIDSWVNWYKKNNFAVPHHHKGGGHLSVVYFLDVEKTNAQFIFHKDSSFQLIKKNDNKNSFTNFLKIIDVKDGDVLMFPTSLVHSVTVNSTDKLRITCASNFTVCYDNKRKDY